MEPRALSGIRESAEGAAATRPRHGWGRVVHVAGGLVGLLLFVYLVWTVGPGRLWLELRGLSWLFFWALAVFFLSKVFMAVAWWRLLEPQTRQAVGLGYLIWTTVVGGAINDVTPGGVAGEALKAAYVAERTTGVQVASSLLVHNVLYVLTNILLLAGGALYLTLSRSSSIGLRLGAAGVVGAGLLLGLVGFRLLSRGVLSGATGRFRRTKWQWLAERIEDWHRAAARVDGQIQDLYRSRARDLWGAWWWMLASRAAAAGETFFLIRALGWPVGLWDTWLIAALAVVVYVLFPFLPGQVGAMEGASYAFYPMVGYPPELGVAVEVSRKMRMVVFLGLGLVLLALKKRTWGRLETMGPVEFRVGRTVNQRAR